MGAGLAPDLIVCLSDDVERPIRIKLGDRCVDMTLTVAEKVAQALHKATKYKRRQEWREGGSGGS